MPTLTEYPQWVVGIPQLESRQAFSVDLVNGQAASLANRTSYLKTFQEEVVSARGSYANLGARLDAMVWNGPTFTKEMWTRWDSLVEEVGEAREGFGSLLERIHNLLDGPTFFGSPRVPMLSFDDDSSRVPSTHWVRQLAATIEGGNGGGDVADTLSLGAPLGAFRPFAVYSDGLAYPVTSIEISPVVHGITLESGGGGQTVSVNRRFGAFISCPNSLDVGPMFLGATGMLSSTPGGGNAVLLGRVISSTQIWFAPGPIVKVVS